jgi:WXG100 family type VII secretion target
MAYVPGATQQTDQALLDQQARQLQTHWSSLTQNGDIIKNELVKLESVWSGNASVEFQNAANTWIAGYNEVLTGLRTLISHVDAANVETADSETKRAGLNTSSWTST